MSALFSSLCHFFLLNRWLYIRQNPMKQRTILKMAAPTEVILTSELIGHFWNACLWDMSSGTMLVSYKGGVSAPHTLQVLGEDHLISAQHNKPILNVWSLQKKDTQQQRVVCPGKVSSLAVSSDGLYCVVAITEKLHLWQVSSGQLLGVVSGHYQTVNCVKFTDDGSHFVSGGDDNLVIVWSLSRVVSEFLNSAASSAKPRHLWSQHTLPVTDVHVGYGATRARVASASLDHTCKLWDISSGQLLLSVIFDTGLSSVCLDAAESSIFAGGTDGKIFQVNLFEKPMSKERHMPADDSYTFSGHSKEVSCLSISLDGTQLVSGSHDCTVRCWDIASRQCTRTITLKGAVTNAAILAAPLSAVSNTVTSLPSQHTLCKRLGQQSMDQESSETVVGVRIHSLPQVDSWSEDSVVVSTRDLQSVLHNFSTSTTEKDIGDLQQKLAELKQVNKQLFHFAKTQVIETAADR